MTQHDRIEMKLDAVLRVQRILLQEIVRMAQQLDDIIEDVRTCKGVLESTKVWFDGYRERLQAAIDAAIGNGATAAQLAPVVAEADAAAAKAAEVAAAIAENP